MIDLNEIMEVIEGDDERRVRLYHARQSGLWIAQTFKDDASSRALAAASTDTPEGALYGLYIQYQDDARILDALRSLILALKERRDAIRRLDRIFLE